MKNSVIQPAYMVSLGCPKNLVDSEVMAGALLMSGIGITRDPDEAGIFIINTCAFIAPGRNEAEEVIRRAVRWKKRKRGRGRIVVSGCLVQWDRECYYRETYPEVDLWAGVDAAAQMGKLVFNLFQTAANPGTAAPDSPRFIYDEHTPRLKLTLPHLAYLKIAEGCNNHCSYCAIPAIRGRLRSRTIDSIRSETRNLLRDGTREIILIAQDTTAFGHDRPDSGDNPAALVRAADSFDGDYWVRIMYTHPAHYDDAFIDSIAASRHVIPYLDIPLQHISDKILTAMGRKTSSDAIFELLSKLRKKLPKLALRTTFITGFPGEDEDDFMKLCEFIRTQQFERCGVFAYCPEPGTRAAVMPGQVAEEEKNWRAEQIMEIQSKISLNRNKKLVGKNFDVIIDFINARGAVGRTYMDAPDIDNVVNIAGAGQLSAGNFAKVQITAAGAYDLEAEADGTEKTGKKG